MAGLFLGFLTGVCVAIHMVHQRFIVHRISSAKFFKNLPPPKQKRFFLRIGLPKLNLPFFIRLLILLLLLIAILNFEKEISLGKIKSIGLWVILDTSASMTTIEKKNITRMDIAKNTAVKAIMQAQKTSQNQDLNFKLSTFDMELKDILFTKDLKKIKKAINEIKPRALGTDLISVRNNMFFLQESSNDNNMSHIIVITDLPSPTWVNKIEKQIVIWKDIASCVNNTGITRIHSSKNILSGNVQKIYIEIKSYGSSMQNRKFKIIDPDKKIQYNQTININNIWKKSYKIEKSGEYIIQILPNDAYSLDDMAIIEVPKKQIIKADWQIPDKRLLKKIKWINNKKNPNIRVVSKIIKNDNTPALIIGSGYNKNNKTSITGSFIESSPLLEDINFDVVELSGIEGADLNYDNFYPVLSGTDKVWIAQRDNPPAVYIPGLPSVEKDDNLYRMSATIFFNAIRWLLNKQSSKPLYTITNPAYPEPYGNHLALHEDEGNTNKKTLSYNDLDNIHPIRIIDNKSPIWPLFLMTAMILLLIERLLLIFGKGKWL